MLRPLLHYLILHLRRVHSLSLMLSGSGLPTLLCCLLEGMSLGFFQGTQYTVAVTVLSGIEEEVESLGLHSSTLGNH